MPLKYGIAFTNEIGDITGWVKDEHGNDLTWDTDDEAFEANDIIYGWIGYVRKYVPLKEI